jgi:hypothetical protein
MDKNEAINLANQKLAELRQKSFEELKNYLSPKGAQTLEIVGMSGKTYQLELQSFWDGAEGGNLRVMVSVDDGSFLRTLKPLSTDFIISPEGTFIGE